MAVGTPSNGGRRRGIVGRQDSGLRLLGLSPRRVGGDGDERAETIVEPGDPIERVLNQFDRADLARSVRQPPPPMR